MSKSLTACSIRRISLEIILKRSKWFSLSIFLKISPFFQSDILSSIGFSVYIVSFMLSFLFVFSVQDEPVSKTGFVSDDFSINIVDGIFTNGSCWATFSDKLEEIGNMRFSVTGREGEDRAKMMYCAGYLEGVIMQKRIYQSFVNNIYVIYGDDRSNITYDENLHTFYEENYEYMKDMIESNKDVEYWQNIGAFLKISEGMINGYYSVAPENENISHADFLITNNMPDIFDIMTAFSTLSPTDNLRARCTAGIRLLPDYSDVYVMHNSWTDYRNSFGLVIDYEFPVPGFSGKKLSISTMPGMISSLDDFYVSDSGLVVFETSIMSQDVDMLKSFVTPKNLLDGYRTLIAMFTAKNGTEWADIFLKYNSGTYNNDYYVTDMNLFKRKEKPPQHFVTLIEQVPSKTHYVYDVTENLTKDGFIASFNVPFTEEVYYICKYDKVENTSEYYHPYLTHPRYLISKRELPSVSNFEQFKKFSRFNNYKRDEYSQGDPLNVIASREDLLGKSPSGAVNQKAITASRGFTTMEYQYCASATNENQDTPTFQWSTGPFKDRKRLGLPDVQNFTWVTISNSKFNRCEQYNKNDCIKQDFCGYCGKSKKCMPGDEDGPFTDKCYDGWEAKFTSYTVYIAVTITIAVLVLFGGIALAVFIYRRSRKNALESKPLLESRDV